MYNRPLVLSQDDGLLFMQPRAHSNTYQLNNTAFSHKEEGEQEEDPTPKVKDEEHLTEEEGEDGHQ